MSHTSIASDALTPAAATPPPVFSFSSAKWPERDRLEAVRELYARAIVKFDVDPVPNTPLHLEATFHALPGLGLAFASGTMTPGSLGWDTSPGGAGVEGATVPSPASGAVETVAAPASS